MTSGAVFFKKVAVSEFDDAIIMIIEFFRIGLAKPTGDAAFWDEFYFHTFIVTSLFEKHKEEDMAKQPWTEKLFDKGEESLRRSSKSVDKWANRTLTILATIFFIVIIIMIGTMIYFSVGGSNAKKAQEGFYSSGAAVAASSSQTVEAPAENTEDGEESSQSSGPGTIQVQSGEGEAAIAARAGISIAELERLNPQHMTQGYWYANPGDVVKVE